MPAPPRPVYWRRVRSRPEPALRTLQEQFWRAISTPNGIAGAPVLAVIEPSPALTPAERLDIYAGMYVARLVDVLREDYPCVVTILGDDRFHALAHAYVTRHASEHPSIRYVGRAFAAFLATEEPGMPFLADLARLEWARLAVFDAPDPTPLGLDALLAVPPDDWSGLRFVPIAALEVLESPWPVHRLWGDDADTTCAAERTALRVWRQGLQVFHAPMAADEEAALAHLRAGETFGVMCEGFDDPEAAAALLLRWIEDGIVETTAPSPAPSGASPL